MAVFQNYTEYHKLKGLQADHLMVIPSWTTSGRPSGGDIFANLIGINRDITSFPILEWYDGTTWHQSGAGGVIETDPVFTSSFVSGITSIGAGLQIVGGQLSSIITQYTAENAQDDVGGILSSEFTYNDAANTISINSIAATKVVTDSTHRFVTDVQTSNFQDAYDNKIVSAAFSGSTTKTFTLTKNNGSTITATFNDLGEVNTGSSIGGGLDIFSSKVGADLQFNSLSISDFDITSNLISIDAALKNTWNAKQDAIILTTTGTSGVATLSSNTLNIPNYTYTLPIATTSILGGVKVDGTTITITGDGTISAAGVGGGGSTDWASITSKPNSGNFIFNQSVSAQSSANFNIDGNGDIGGKIRIGTTDLGSYKLQVNGDIKGASSTFKIVGFGSNARVDLNDSGGASLFYGSNFVQVASSSLNMGIGNGTIFTINGTTTEITSGAIKFTPLAGSGTRMVVADSTGLVSTQAIPSGSLTLTTTGTSGPATLVSNTLNIPNYTFTVNGNVNNRLLTANGNSGSIDGEPNLTFDSSILTVTGDVKVVNKLGAGVAPIFTLHTSSTGNTSGSSAFLHGEFWGTTIGTTNTTSSYDALMVTTGIVSGGSGGTTVFKVRGDGLVTVNTLSGTGTRMVVSNSSGDLSTQTIPAGDITGATNLGGGLANYDSKSGSNLRFNTFASSDFDLGVAGSNLISIDAALKATWNAKQDQLSGTGIIRASGTTISYSLLSGSDLDNIFSSNGLLKRTGVNTYTVDTSTYLTANQTISLSSDVAGSGATSISTTVNGIKGNVLPSLSTGYLKWSGSAWVFDTPTGEANTASNVNATINPNYAGFFKVKSGVDLQFKSVSTPDLSGVKISSSTNEVEVRDNEWDYKGAVSYVTSDSAPHQISSLTMNIPAGSAGHVVVDVEAISQAGEHYGYQRTLYYTKDASSVYTFQGATTFTQSTSTITGLGSVPVTVIDDISHNLVPVVTGLASTTIYWRVGIREFHVFPNL